MYQSIMAAKIVFFDLYSLYSVGKCLAIATAVVVVQRMCFFARWGGVINSRSRYPAEPKPATLAVAQYVQGKRPFALAATTIYLNSIEPSGKVTCPNNSSCCCPTYVPFS